VSVPASELLLLDPQLAIEATRGIRRRNRRVEELLVMRTFRTNLKLEGEVAPCEKSSHLKVGRK
jgi:uncharacterized protein YcbX